MLNIPFLHLNVMKEVAKCVIKISQKTCFRLGNLLGHMKIMELIFQVKLTLLQNMTLKSILNWLLIDILFLENDYNQEKIYKCGTWMDPG